MKKNTIKLSLAFIAIFFISITTHAQDDEKTQRIKASYVLAFGMLPSRSEVNYYLTQPEASSLKALMDRHVAFIITGGYRREAIVNSYKDALGIIPDENMIGFYAKNNMTYNDLMNAHMVWLSGSPSEYEKLINRAYSFALGRKASSLEIDKWKNLSQKYSYMMMAGYLQNRKGKYTLQCYPEENAMSLGISSSAVLGARVSLSIAKEAVFISHNGSAIQGGKLIAAGAGNLITNDGGTLVAAGGAGIALVSGAN